jgi:hypothetical protein
VSHEQTEFAEFFQASWEPCLRAVVASTGSVQLAEDQVAEAFVIYGSKIPRGVKLSIGYRQDSQDREISFTLIKAGAPLTCTSMPDHGPHGDDGPQG